MKTELLLEGFRQMLRIRRAEEAITKDFLENKIFSFYHSCVYQEASAVGVCMALTKEDRVFGNHRSHGHMLAKGGDLYRMIAEIYGKADGCCRGKGGSMHLYDRSVGFMGSAPILGAMVPIAAGSAYQQKAAGEKAITVIFFGDGASEEGVVYETLNLAALWELPILFVLENNLYATATPESVRRPRTFSRSRLVTSLGVTYTEIDGQSLPVVYETAKSFRDYMTKIGGPALIEVKTLRHMAHSGPIFDEKSRITDTKEVRDSRDPIRLMLAALRSEGVAAETLAHIEEEVRAEVETAMQKAKAAPEPDPSELLEDVFV